MRNEELACLLFVVPVLHLISLTFQQDNARPLVARIYHDFLTNNNIHPLDLDRPPYIHDPFPIEYFWEKAG